MQNPDNNMDELFRKAAENYPLKTDMPDWDDIAPALLSTPITTTSSKKGKGKIMGLFLLGFLLLASSSLLIHFYTTKTKDITSSINPATKKDFNKTNNVNSLQDKRTTTTGVIDEVKSPVQQTNIQQKVNSIEGTTSSKNKKAKLVSGNFILTEVTNSSPETIGETYDNQEQIDINSNLKTVLLNNRDTSIPKTVVAALIKKDVNDTTIKLAAQLSQTKKRNNKEHGIYFGMLAGMQLSQVEGQGFKKPGLSIGAIAGYRFNNRMSVEGGLIYSKKKYYSDGKYFDPAKTGTAMPAGMKVVSLEGESSVVEIPVKIKYDFFKNKQSGWFVTGGFSSTVLLNENNEYAALVFGTPRNMNVTYQQNRSYFISAVNFSIGHEFKAFKKSNFRIEPYIQIPVKGIGVGSMPVFTTGVHVGITLPGFK